MDGDQNCSRPIRIVALERAVITGWMPKGKNLETGERKVSEKGNIK